MGAGELSKKEEKRKIHGHGQQCGDFLREGNWGSGGGYGGINRMEGDLTWVGEHTIQCADDVM